MVIKEKKKFSKTQPPFKASSKPLITVIEVQPSKKANSD